MKANYSKVIRGSELEYQKTSHNSGIKKILNCDGPKCTIPQIAIGYLTPNEYIIEHRHQDMNEYFFILDGEGQFDIENEIVEVKADDLIIVQSPNLHSLKAFSNGLKFFYWGVVENTTVK